MPTQGSQGQSSFTRVVQLGDPFAARCRNEPWFAGRWPAEWIWLSNARAPVVLRFRLRFQIVTKESFKLHVSADERYVLFANGERLGRGPERGDARRWFFESYELELSPGAHEISALVWALGDLAPYAQVSRRPGFLLAVEGALEDTLNTGRGNWEACALPSYSFEPRGFHGFTGCNVIVSGSANTESTEAFGTVAAVEPAIGRALGAELPNVHELSPASLPAMVSTPWTRCAVRFAATRAAQPEPERCDAEGHDPVLAEGFNALLTGDSPLTLPARFSGRAILDMQDYVAAYPRLTTHGGAGSTLRLRWAESLYVTSQQQTDKEAVDGASKGNRDQVLGKYFHGWGDTFLPAGGASTFETLWWQAGRYVEISIENPNEPLTLESLTFEETRYPLAASGSFHCDDARVQRTLPLLRRAIELCSHETFMDCPYYEQLQYAGDTRLEILATYALSTDDKLAKKAILCFDESRGSDGYIESRYPSRTAIPIPPFSLCWVGMVHDFARYRDDAEFVRERLLGVRAIMDRFLSRLSPSGLLSPPRGWSFTDWAPEWPHGIPFGDSANEASSVLNFQLALALKYAADLERLFGEPELCARFERHRATLVNALHDAFFCEARGLFASDRDRTRFAEHSQCLAVLSGAVSSAQVRPLLERTLLAHDLTRTTWYFSHYLLEALACAGLEAPIFERLEPWFELHGQGFKTTPERPEPSRSDCHAWSSHPLHHFFASILGVTPVGPGFAIVQIRPLLGMLQYAKGTLPHPRGFIQVEARKNGSSELQITARLPDGVTLASSSTPGIRLIC